MEKTYKEHVLVSTMDIDGSYIFTCNGPLVNDFKSYARFSYSFDPIKTFVEQIDKALEVKNEL